MLFYMFTPILGEDGPNFEEHIFQLGWNHQPASTTRTTPMGNPYISPI